MRSLLKALLLLLGLAVVVGAIGLWYVVDSGVSAKEQPGRVEEFAARRVRNMAIARRAESLTNPVQYSADVIAEGRAHFADHCATCQANDGSGKTDIGQGLWPKAPDMRLAATQNLTDGQLFWIIENGIRFTGMPAWSTGTKEGETASWHLVHFIRRLPKLTPEELKEVESLNPQPPAEIRQQIEEEKSERRTRQTARCTGNPAQAPRRRPVNGPPTPMRPQFTSVTSSRTSRAPRGIETRRARLRA